MRFSVVIPTCNRSEKLADCLRALLAQDFDRSQYEIVVVDDGSTDDTQVVLEKFQKSSSIPVRFFRQPNRGQGAARNHGIEEARGEIVLLIGDDIIASPQLLREHGQLHRRHPEENAAVLGFITWHPSLPITSLMEFMERGGAIFGRFGGHQFAFDLLRGKTEADYRFFYTSNVSLKRTLLLQYKFDPWFSGYGWEDIELGYRLTKQVGLRIFYEPAALAYHDHMMDERQFQNRMRQIGSSAPLIQAKYPELNRVPSAKKQFVFRALAHPLSLKLLKPLSRNLYWYALSKKYFLEGLKEYNRNVS